MSRKELTFDFRLEVVGNIDIHNYDYGVWLFSSLYCPILCARPSSSDLKIFTMLLYPSQYFCCLQNLLEYLMTKEPTSPTWQEAVMSKLRLYIKHANPDIIDDVKW